MSRPMPEPGHYNVTEHGMLELWRDERFSLTSRIFLIWLWNSHNNGWFRMNLDSLKLLLDDPDRGISHSIGAIEAAYHRVACYEVQGKRLFKWNAKKGRYDRRYRRGETPQAFEERTRKCKSVQAALRLLFSIRGLIIRHGTAPHSKKQFAKELSMHPVTVKKQLKWLAEEGLIVRYGGNGGSGKNACCRYVEPKAEPLRMALEDKFGEHRETNAYLSAKKEMWWEERRQKTSESVTSDENNDEDAILMGVANPLTPGIANSLTPAASGDSESAYPEDSESAHPILTRIRRMTRQF
jgi:hypothetical protein